MKRPFFFLFLTSLSLLFGCQRVTDQDWPQFKKDNYRSGCIEADFSLSRFGKKWTYDTGQEPVPAWYGPAKEDAFAWSGPLPSMRDYDLSYSPIVVGNALYYASSADDAVHCHHVQTGKEKWRFTTGGPIRIAPTYYKGRVYVGSDDGYVYCLNARTGHLQWKFTPTPRHPERLLNNGRFISIYPIRTGVLIEDGIAYFGASLMPWKKSYVCAVDARSGKVGKPGTYVKEYDTNSMTLEGAMASTGKMLIQPQGRIAPVLINKSTGETAGQLSGTGGCFVLVTPDNSVIHGETSRWISIQETALEEKQPKFMSYSNGKEIVVKDSVSYVLNDHSLVAYNRNTKKMIWLRQHIRAHRIIVAGDVLFAGMTDRVEGISLNNGQTIWSCPVSGTIYALSFSRNVLYASSSEGYLYAFAEGGEEGMYFAENEDKDPEIQQRQNRKRKKPSQHLRSLLSYGPFIQPFSPDSVTLTVQTMEPTRLTVHWNLAEPQTSLTDSSSVRLHTFRLPVRKGMQYDYQLISEKGDSAQFNYDNFFNFFTRHTSDYTGIADEVLPEVSEYLEEKGAHVGLCLVGGKQADRIAVELAENTPMNIVLVESSQRKYSRFVEKLQNSKSYGRKISAIKVNTGQPLPFISEIADLVWVNDANKVDPDEVIRLIAPDQYAVVTGVEPQKWLQSAMLDWQVTVEQVTKDYFLLKKKPIEAIGEWTHMHGDARNASYAGESLYGNSQTSDFEAQWMGRPGARFITDRSGRKPSPLAINGRLFIQGKERIAALSVFNGSILWMKDMPGIIRMNMAHDCSNWACDSSHLYIAHRHYLLKVDQQNGELTRQFHMYVPNDTTFHWGYVGVWPDQIIGSTTVKRAQFTSYHGGREQGWYDSQAGPNAYKVLSHRLFSVDKEEGHLCWEYLPDGAIINTTLTGDDQYLYFVESPSVLPESLERGRGGDELYKHTRLVCLDVKTGETVYSSRFQTEPGKAVYFMAINSGKAAIVASGDEHYDIHVLNLADGKEVWNRQIKWFHTNHGAHMSKPAISGDRLVVKPFIYNLHTGEQYSYNVPKAGHGCAHYALSDNAIFYRGGSCTMFDFETRHFSKWERLRPDCWISTIPAQGMVLSPEAGGGCSCGLWYETSMVFAPVSRAPILIRAYTDDSLRDNKDETWGQFRTECNTNQFSDQLKIEFQLKTGVEGPIYYTLDGSVPTTSSPVYTEPFLLHDSATVTATVFIEKAGKKRPFSRSRTYTKISDHENS